MRTIKQIVEEVDKVHANYKSAKIDLTESVCATYSFRAEDIVHNYKLGLINWNEMIGQLNHLDSEVQRTLKSLNL